MTSNSPPACDLTGLCARTCPRLQTGHRRLSCFLPAQMPAGFTGALRTPRRNEIRTSRKDAKATTHHLGGCPGCQVRASANPMRHVVRLREVKYPAAHLLPLFSENRPSSGQPVSLSSPTSCETRYGTRVQSMALGQNCLDSHPSFATSPGQVSNLSLPRSVSPEAMILRVPPSWITL